MSYDITGYVFKIRAANEKEKTAVAPLRLGLAGAENSSLGMQAFTDASLR